MTGKCKQDFEKWLMDTDYLTRDRGTDGLDVHMLYNQLPESLLFAAIQDFADSVEYLISIDAYKGGVFVWDMYTPDSVFTDGDSFKTRPEARIEAVKQFNILYNEKQSDTPQ